MPASAYATATCTLFSSKYILYAYSRPSLHLYLYNLLLPSFYSTTLSFLLFLSAAFVTSQLIHLYKSIPTLYPLILLLRCAPRTVPAAYLAQHHLSHWVLFFRSVRIFARVNMSAHIRRRR